MSCFWLSRTKLIPKCFWILANSIIFFSLLRRQGNKKKKKRSFLKLDIISNLLETLGLVLRQAILVHDPTSPDPFGGFTGVENEGFLEADGPEILASDHPISSGGLPVAGSRNAVRPIAVPILPISRYIEVPLFLPYSRQRCHSSHTNN